MARSGTTVFTHVLNQHYKINVFHNVYNYENDMIFSKNVDAMENVVVQFKSRRVAFKRPWSESMADFFVEHMPNAHYLAMLKPFDMINKSWQKSTWTKDLWGEDDKIRRNKYDKHLKFLQDFPLKLKIIDYPNFVKQTNKVMFEVTDFLGLLNYRKINNKFVPIFDISMVKHNGQWDFMKN